MVAALAFTAGCETQSSPDADDAGASAAPENNDDNDDSNDEPSGSNNEPSGNGSANEDNSCNDDFDCEDPDALFCVNGVCVDEDGEPVGQPSNSDEEPDEPADDDDEPAAEDPEPEPEADAGAPSDDDEETPPVDDNDPPPVNNGVATVTRIYQYTGAIDFPSSFAFAHWSGDDYFGGQSCEASAGNIRTCSTVVDRARRWRTSVKSGWPGAGSSLPGKDGTTGDAQMYVGLSVSEFDGTVTRTCFSRMVPNAAGDGYDLEVLEDCSLPNLSDANADSDGDGVRNGLDCEDGNPSITCDANDDANTNPGGNASLKTLAVHAFGGNPNPGSMRLLVKTGGYREIYQQGDSRNRPGEYCEKISAADPANSFTTQPAVRCWVKDVDRSQPFRHNIEVDGVYAANSTTSGDCLRKLREYILDENTYPAGRYDSLSGGGYVQMEDELVSVNDGCDIVLAARP